MIVDISFRIDPKAPQLNASFDKEVPTLSGAIYDMYPDFTEYAELHWGEEQISLSYRYDISTIIEDVIWMVFELSADVQERTLSLGVLTLLQLYGISIG